MGYWLDGRGSIRGGGKGNFSELHSVQTGSGAYPTSYQMDTGGSLSGVKRPGREVDHPSSFIAEVKNGQAIPQLPTCLHGVALN
jgi:hypothetical protein